MPNKRKANEAAPPADRQDAERQRLTGVADKFRQEMEALSLQVRDLILAQPPVQLLGYLMSQFHMAIIGGVQDAEEDYRPDKEMLKAFQFVLEYAHAVWSSQADLMDEASPLDEAKAGSLFDVSEQLQTKTMMYCMASAAANIDPARSARSGDMEFHAKSSWTLIRGHRYQVLEEEFFRFVLAPHADALREAYGMGPDEIALGVQGIADAMRSGFSTAVEDMMQRMDQAYALVDQTGEDLGAVIARMRDEDVEFQNDASGSVKDMFFGGTCNLSRHTNFTPALLEDLSYAPGENTEFFAPGEFCGTPMRTLPGRVKPAVRLGGEVYATDGQFVRDSAYRAIQRGVCARLPYRDAWLKKQAVLVEQAFPTIFTEQLANARIFNSVFYKDVDTGGWAETDLLVMVGDALLVIEAKAGNLPMQSPATSFKTHERVIQDLVVKAYRQCKRFLAYVASAPEVPLYSLQEGKYIEVGRIKRGDFRVVLPIGLTVEAFTPFSAMAKELPEVQPILGKHPFVSMSVDDLFVLNRFLPTTGALLHYLEVRQQVAGIRNAMLFDEIDHLGAYISHNRIDMTIRDQLAEADLITLDAFSDVVDRHFEGPDWETTPVPSQVFPERLVNVLETLDQARPAGWLRMDSFLRDFAGDGRSTLADQIDLLAPTLAEHPRRRIQIGEEHPLQLWLCRAGAEPSPAEARDQAQIGCLTVGASVMAVLTLSYRQPGQMSRAACSTFASPTILQTNYGDLSKEADRQRGRMTDLRKTGKTAKRKR